MTGLQLPPQTGLGRRERVREGPLVSCIMPTTGRRSFALNAMRLFAAQDYPHRELVVVTDRGADEELERELSDDPLIRVVQARAGASIGSKRNRACRAARGDIIAHWDDDDWYGPARLSAQIEPLLAGRADVTGLVTSVFLDLPRWRFWAVTPSLHRRLFAGDVHGGTLVYTRHVWDRLARYPDTSLAEDACLLMAALRRGARLERVSGDGVFIYVRHGHNAWRFVCGQHDERSDWRRAPEPPMPHEDRAFYRARCAASSRPAVPLVSCIMPTADRRALVGRAVAYFLRQDYPVRELVVLDDGDDGVGDLMPADPRIRYVRLEQRLGLGDKRNRACELARGTVIAHWDDDDWYAPHRLSYQIGHLRESDADVCGPGRLICFDPTRRLAWRYERGAPWVAGSGLCYRREAWLDAPFPRVNVGEDTRFVYGRRRGAVSVLRDERILVSLIHPANSSPKPTGSPGWRPYPIAEVRALLGGDYRTYEPSSQRTTPTAPKPVAAARNAPSSSCDLACSSQSRAPGGSAASSASRSPKT